MIVQKLDDYAEFIIRAKICIQNVEKNMNQKHFETARFMAHELKLIAIHLEQSIQHEMLKQEIKEV
jgi:hypothetical protein